MKRKRTKGKPIPVGTAIFMLVAGIILGSVFTFGMQYWNSDIKREDALRIEATYEKHTVREYRVKNTRTRRVVLYFADNDPLSIDSAYVNDDLLETLDGLTEGTKAIMLVHPNSDTSLDMRAGGACILDFTDTERIMGGQKTGFLILGVVMYFCAAYAVYSLVKRYICTRKSTC